MSIILYSNCNIYVQTKEFSLSIQIAQLCFISRSSSLGYYIFIEDINVNDLIFQLPNDADMIFNVTVNTNCIIFFSTMSLCLRSSHEVLSYECALHLLVLQSTITYSYLNHEVLGESEVTKCNSLGSIGLSGTSNL